MQREVAAAPTADNDNRPAAFDAAVLAYKGALLAYINKRVPHGKREDAMQDVMAEIFAKWANYRINDTANPYGKGSGFRSWLFWQARGCLSNEASRNRVSLVYVDSYKSCRGQCPPNQENVAAASLAVGRLTGRNGSVLLKRAMGFSLKEIGEEMNITKERVRQLEEKARAKLLKVAA